MKDSPRTRWLPLLLMALLLSPLLPYEASAVDLKDVCKEYGLAFKQMFEKLCDDDKPKAPKKEEWKIEDNRAFDEFIKKECGRPDRHWWNIETNRCEQYGP